MIQNTPTLERIEAQAFRRQETAFCVLTMLVLAALLVLHTWFASLLGEPSRSVILLLGGSFLVKALEWYWLSRQEDGISGNIARVESTISIVTLFLLAWVLAIFTDRDDAPYFVLLAIAILQCAYHFGLLPTVMTIAAAVGMMFGWALHFFALHPPPRPTEFLECGMISVIYGMMGLLVWYLVNQLGKKEAKLFEKVTELEKTRNRLALEEKLAAVGRLASGIAHEIRNPVAMIASSLATATYPNADPGEREEMFAIAAHEAKRLENLTSDFLVYARPSSPERTQVQVSEVLDHVAQVAQVRASEFSIQVQYQACVDRTAFMDPFQVEGALVNIVLNAIAATPAGGTIAIRSRIDGERILFEIENSGGKIADAAIVRIFEPFFTTKQTGTGLGLAIARGVARAHCGDLWVSRNDDGAVAFTMAVSATDAHPEVGELIYGQSADR